MSEVVTDGQRQERYTRGVEGQTLVVAPGLPALGASSEHTLSKPLVPG